MKHENTNDGRDERLNRNDAVPSDDGTDMNMTPDESGAGIGCESTADTTPKECQLPHPPEPDPAHEPEETDTPHEGDGKEEPTESEQHTQEVEDTFERLTDMLNTRRYVDFRAELDALLPVEIADFFAELPAARLPAVFKLLSKDQAAAVFAELDVEEQQRIILAMSDRELSAIVEDLSLDDAVDMLEELPASIVHRVMRNAQPETRAAINRFLAYPEDSAGSVMTAEFIDLHRDMTCAQAVDHIRKTGIDKETVYVAYVTDAARVLQGIVPLRTLLFAKPDDSIENIMDENVICASTLDDKETVASLISRYDLLALPIVDREHRLVGIVTVDDAMDVMEDEFTEDIEIMGGMTPSEKTYLKSSVFDLFKHRIPWLLLLMVSATFTGMIITSFEDALAAQVALTAFIPMLMDTGGNSGSQSSVTVIRALSLGELEFRDLPQVIWKEIRTAVCCGTVLAAACFCKILLVDRLLMGNSSITVAVALVVCLTMAITVLLAKTVGCILPMSAKRLGFDPAVMASPFITTIVDALSLLVYFGIAKALLGV